jgi:hypothetical protein
VAEEKGKKKEEEGNEKRGRGEEGGGWGGVGGRGMGERRIQQQKRGENSTYDTPCGQSPMLTDVNRAAALALPMKSSSPDVV